MDAHDGEPPEGAVLLATIHHDPEVDLHEVDTNTLAGVYRSNVEEFPQANTFLLLAPVSGGVYHLEFNPEAPDPVPAVLALALMQTDDLGPFERAVLHTEGWLRVVREGVESLYEVAFTLSASSIGWDGDNDSLGKGEVVVDPFVRTSAGVRWLGEEEQPDLDTSASGLGADALEMLAKAVSWR